MTLGSVRVMESVMHNFYGSDVICRKGTEALTDSNGYPETM